MLPYMHMILNANFKGNCASRTPIVLTDNTRDNLLTCIKKWRLDISDYIDHKWLSAWQHKQHQLAIDNMKIGEEVWEIDYSSTIPLHQSRKQSQEQDMSKAIANCFVLVRIYMDAQHIRRQHTHYIYTTYPTHDQYLNLSCLQIILTEAHERKVKKITIFSDNGSGFHSVDQILFQSSIANMYSIEWIGNFYPAGEGKSECDRMTARASKYRYQYMLAGHDFNGDINTLVDAVWYTVGHVKPI